MRQDHEQQSLGSLAGDMDVEDLISLEFIQKLVSLFHGYWTKLIIHMNNHPTVSAVQCNVYEYNPIFIFNITALFNFLVNQE